MNRQQRRAHGKEYRNVVDIPAGTVLKGRLVTTGMRFKIPGHKRLPGGVLIKDCKPGDETEFIANIVEGMQIKKTDRKEIK